MIQQLHEKQQNLKNETNIQLDFTNCGELVTLPQTFGCQKDHVLKFWTSSSMLIYRRVCKKCKRNKICRYVCENCKEYYCLQCVPIQLYVGYKDQVDLCAAKHPTSFRQGCFVCDVCNVSQPTGTSVVCFECDFDICQNCIKAKNYIGIKLKL